MPSQENRVSLKMDVITTAVIIGAGLFIIDRFGHDQETYWTVMGILGITALAYLAKAINSSRRE